MTPSFCIPKGLFLPLSAFFPSSPLFYSHMTDCLVVSLLPALMLPSLQGLAVSTGVGQSGFQVGLHCLFLTSWCLTDSAVKWEEPSGTPQCVLMKMD